MLTIKTIVAGILIANLAYATKKPICDWVIRRITGRAFDQIVDGYRDISEESVIEVRQGEKEIFDFPTVGYTNGVGPCLGLAVINKKTKRVYLAHYDGWMTDESGPLLTQAAKEANSPSDLQVVIVGNQIASGPRDPMWEEQRQTAKEVSDFVLNRLKELGVPETQITNKMRMLPGQSAYGIFVDTIKKRIYYQKLKPSEARGQ